jgi:hypothetical protein
MDPARPSTFSWLSGRGFSSILIWSMGIWRISKLCVSAGALPGSSGGEVIASAFYGGASIV